jgi:cytosine/creatinine deaminase
VMDPWYGMGSGDMLEVAHMGLHVAQMTSQAGIRACFDAVTVNAARVMHLEGYGLAPGCEASFVLLQARDVVEAIRLRATRLQVWKRGRLVASTAPVVPQIFVGAAPRAVHFSQS